MKHRRAHALRRRYGRSESGGLCKSASRVQVLLFPRDKFNVVEAKAWARKHDWKTSDVDVPESGEFIHLRQEDPSHFRRIRTVHLGGRGVQARVGFPVC